jgi:peptidyl-prolyl cis-trans isomerase D
MLKILRHKKTAKKVWIFLALIIIPAFALWGFGGAFRTREEKMPAGKISGRDISNLELKDSLSAVTTTALMQYGDKLPEIQKFLNLEAQAWQRLILLEEAKKRSIKASDQEVIKTIAEVPYFKYKDSFDKRTYEQTLQYVFRLKPREFEEQVRQGIILNKLYKQTTDSLTIDDNDVRKNYEKKNQEISVYYVASLISDFAKKIRPKDAQLKDYFEKNKEKFREAAPAGKDKKEAVIPEFKSIKQKIRDAYINDEAIKKAEDKINQCANELKTQDLKKAAKKCGLKVKETAPFKFAANIDKIGASDKFWTIAKALKDGANSEIIKLPSGFYIIKVKSVIKIDEKKYEQDKVALKEIMLDQKKQEKFKDFLTGLNKNAQQFKTISK